MKILITGGLGFVGTSLVKSLTESGHEVTVVNRKTGRRSGLEGKARIVEADTSVPGGWQELIASHDLVVNLAGASIYRRWTGRFKNEILRSRVDTTKNVVDAITGSGRAIDLFSASAVGYYGSHGDEEIDENGAAGSDFLAGVCASWEGEARRAERSGSRVVYCRFGVILGKGGGALSQLETMFSFHLGSVLGSGLQWFSWIHMEDLVQMFHFLIREKNVSGPVNFTTPFPVTNRTLTGALAKAMKKRVILPPAPSFAIRLIMGEFGDFLLKGQKALPKVAMDRGFAFQYPEIGPALESLLR